MYWQDDEGKKSGYQVPDDVVDLSYRISCRALPIDHAYSLSRAIRHITGDRIKRHYRYRCG